MSGYEVYKEAIVVLTRCVIYAVIGAIAFLVGIVILRLVISILLLISGASGLSDRSWDIIIITLGIIGGIIGGLMPVFEARRKKQSERKQWEIARKNQIDNMF